MVQFDRNDTFVGRNEILDHVYLKLTPRRYLDADRAPSPPLDARSSCIEGVDLSATDQNCQGSYQCNTRSGGRFSFSRTRYIQGQAHS